MTIIRDCLTRERVDMAAQQAVNEDIARVLFLCSNADQIHARDLRFVLFHLLTVTPFSSIVAQVHARAFPGNDNNPLSLTDALGRVFDGTVLRGRHCKPIANVLVRWADEWTLRFASLRRLLGESNDGDDINSNDNNVVNNS
jgi:hypothetical protein